MSKSRVVTFLLGVLCIAVVVSVVRRNSGRNVGGLVVEGKPAETAFVGRWELETASLPSVTNRTGKTLIRAQLTLTPDGRFTATDLPIEDGFSNPKWRLKSGEGHWELYRNQYWVVSLGFADGFSTPLDIRAKNGNLIALTYSVGDPDSNERWIWRRAAE
jgi:hypothetical protein